MEQKSYPVVGMGYRPFDEQQVYNKLFPGARLILQREPQNPHDPNAIAVCVSAGDTADEKRWHVGYLPAKIAAKVAPRIDNGEEFAAEHTDHGWLEITWFGHGDGPLSNVAEPQSWGNGDA